MFDLLTYEKGCGVLRMLEQHIGPEVFRDGVRTYLKAHAYANTVTTDLWDALEDASGAPVRDVMDTFILQGGHPLVTLDGDELHQRPFAYGPVPGCRVGHRLALERAGGPAHPARRRANPAPPCAVSSSGPSRRRCREVAAGWPWSMPVAGACSGSAMRPRAVWPWPGILPSSPRSSGPTFSATPGPPRWPGTRRSRISSQVAARLGLEPDPAPWAPGRRRALVLCNRIAAPDDHAALHEAVAALVGPFFAPRLRGHAGEGERTPTLRVPGDQPPRHGRGQRGGASGGRSPFRRLTHGGGCDADPPRHRGGHPGRGGAAAAPGRLRHGAGALPIRLDATGRDALARCAGGLP